MYCLSGTLNVLPILIDVFWIFESALRRHACHVLIKVVDICNLHFLSDICHLHSLSQLLNGQSRWKLRCQKNGVRMFSFVWSSMGIYVDFSSFSLPDNFLSFQVITETLCTNVVHVGGWCFCWWQVGVRPARLLKKRFLSHRQGSKS